MSIKNGFDDFTNSLISSLHDDINVAYLGKIIDLYPPQATVQPLALIDGEKQPPVEKVGFLTLPISYNASYMDSNGNYTSSRELSISRPKLDYKTGDNVICTVLNDDDEHFTNDGTYPITRNDKHSLDYSIILGKVASQDDFKGGDD